MYGGAAGPGLGAGFVAEPVEVEPAAAASVGKTGCSWPLEDAAPGLAIGLHQNLFRLVLAQGQMVAAHLDFDRVAHRSEPH